MKPSGLIFSFRMLTLWYGLLAWRATGAESGVVAGVAGRWHFLYLLVPVSVIAQVSGFESGTAMNGAATFVERGRRAQAVGREGLDFCLRTFLDWTKVDAVNGGHIRKNHLW
ncbi:hypothetical protein B0H14DRAFT_2646972 [Mycena olivaceomarginata]|nr:hypothetical protein B0H14DRAFT_2646972 [Mycena olivaceomarginata]